MSDLLGMHDCMCQSYKVYENCGNSFQILQKDIDQMKVDALIYKNEVLYIANECPNLPPEGMEAIQRVENFKEWVVESRLEARLERLKVIDSPYLDWKTLQWEEGRVIGTVKWFNDLMGGGIVIEDKVRFGNPTKSDEIIVPLIDLDYRKMTILKPAQKVAYKPSIDDQKRNIAVDIVPYFYPTIFISKNLSLEFKNDFEEAFSHHPGYSMKEGVISIQETNLLLLDILEEDFPINLHTGAGRSFSTVRRMTAEKELGIPVSYRSGKAISVKLKIRANEMTAEQWEDFYKSLCDNLKEDHPKLYYEIFSSNPKLKYSNP
jgi:cold shock CspA family protein